MGKKEAEIGKIGEWASERRCKRCGANNRAKYKRRRILVSVSFQLFIA